MIEAPTSVALTHLYIYFIYCCLLFIYCLLFAVYGDLEDLDHNIPILETRPKSVHFDPNIDVEETRENRISRKSGT